jgi:Holliday junction resolvase RusA-like endonuclease
MVLAALPAGKAKRDLDNMLKAILDLLVDVQVVEADEYPYCMGISIQWSKAIKQGVAVSLRPAGALECEVAA